MRNRRNERQDYDDDPRYNDEEEYSDEDYDEGYDDEEYEEEYEEDYSDYDDDGEFYSREELELQEKHKQRKKSLDGFKANLRNPFGINEKADNLWDKIRFGSNATKALFIIGIFVIFAIFMVLGFIVSR